MMELALEKKTEDDRCYNRMEFKSIAHDRMCKGFTGNTRKVQGCDRCEYYKRYLQYIKENGNDKF